MTLTVSQAFERFETEIAPTEYQKNTLIPARKRVVIETLEGAFPATSDLPFSAGHLIGSASKNTIIRPIDDVDVLAVFSNKDGIWGTYQYDSQAFLYRVRRAYDGLSVQQVGARGQAVRVFFQNGGHVDVAPVFSRGGGVYHLPSGDGSWILTAPFRANKWFAERHTVLSNQLAPVVRLLKSWNRAHSKRLRSFHLETMAATLFGKLGSNRPSALKVFFESAASWIDVVDPGEQSGVLSTYLTSAARSEVKTSFQSASARADAAIVAQAAGNVAEAKRLWALVLGGEFPTG